MKTISAREAGEQLSGLVDQTADSGQPIQIEGERGNAVLVSADEWRSLQETLHLLSIPGMKESIIEGSKAPPEEWSEEPGW